MKRAENVKVRYKGKKRLLDISARPSGNENRVFGNEEHVIEAKTVCPMSDAGVVINSAVREQLLGESLRQVPMKSNIHETGPDSGMEAAHDCHIKRSKSGLEIGASIEATKVCPVSDPDVNMDSVVRKSMQSESLKHVSSKNKIYKANQGSCVEAVMDCHKQSRGSSPNPVTRVQCKLDKQLSEYIVEPEDNLKVFIPRNVHDGGMKPAICVVNASDNFVTINKSCRMTA